MTLLAGAATAACSSSDDAGPAGGPSSRETPEPPDDAADGAAAPADPPDAATDRSDAGDAGGRCNLLENVASDVPVVRVADDAPAPAGGTIASGTYIVTAATEYTGAAGSSGETGQTVRMTFRFALPEVESVFEGVNRSATTTIDGTKLVTTTTCPSSQATETSYTATASTLSVHIVKSSSVLVYLLTRLDK
ncbi:MAG: hypothetical protein KF764_06690 [Labilithrix sp.]|nr:hypothetical protein [Labilithrix sp.]